MIIEMRTYTLQPGTLAEVEKRFGEALPVREKHSKLAAFWHTEVGPLNQIIHVWAYDSFEQRAAVRAAAIEGRRLAAADPRVRHDPAKRGVPAGAVLAAAGRRASSARCSRSAGTPWSPGPIPGLIERWSEKIEGRAEVLAAGRRHVFGVRRAEQVGAHLGLQGRQRAYSVRAEAAATGNWPARNPPGVVVKQENAFVMPAAFSPIR